MVTLKIPYVKFRHLDKLDGLNKQNLNENLDKCDKSDTVATGFNRTYTPYLM